MLASAYSTAWTVFAILGIALVLWIVIAWKRTSYTFMQAFLYLLNNFFSIVLWRTEVSGPLPVADHQGAVIVSNHVSGIDPLLIQLATKRVVHWMVAREYYYMPGIAISFRALQSICVNRAGIDTAATKQAIRLAQSGGLVGLFPEGRVNMTDELLLSGRPGAALIALRAKVPVIPCYVKNAPYDGTALGSFFMAAKSRVSIGQPIDMTPYYETGGHRATQEELTRRFLVEIARLAGQEDFEPKLAGRNWSPGLEEVSNRKNEVNGQAVSTADARPDGAKPDGVESAAVESDAAMAPVDTPAPLPAVETSSEQGPY